MLLTSEQIQIEALSLPANQRAELADRLLASLGPEESTDIQKEWLALARQRLADLQSGDAQEIEGTDVMARAREMVGT